jgi:CTP synthase
LIGLITEWLDERGEFQQRSVESSWWHNAFRCTKSELVEGTKTREVYGKAEITERHRHRYEMNDRFIPA